MRTVDAVLFDKTGTLTKGQPAVAGLAAVDASRTPQARVLALAAAVEADSEHPLARAIVAAATHRAGRPRRRTSVAHRSRRRGHGRRHATSRSAARRCCATVGLDAPADSGRLRSRRGQIAAPPCCTSPGRARSSGRSRSRTRSGRSRAQAVDQLHAAGVRVAMITGDARAGRRRGRRGSSASTRCSPRCCPTTRTPRSPSCRRAACGSRWSATA